MKALIKKTERTNMEREIHQEPDVLRNILKAYVAEDGQILIELPENTKKIVLVASGSSYHCARFAADLLGKVADFEARAIYSSEFLLKPKVPADEGTLYVFITQSGETSDTSRALKKVKQLGLNTLCITNKDTSSIVSEADYSLFCRAGEEKSIAATKSLVAEMLLVYLIALKVAQRKGLDVSEQIISINTLPQVISETFVLEEKIKQLAGMLKKWKSFIITADGISYAVAKEAALKIKETTYINVNATILGEFMHGHVAILNNVMPLIYISANGVSYSAAKNLEKIKKDYNPPIYIIGLSHERIVPNFNITINNEDATLRMFSNVVVTQLLAMHLAKKLGRNVDEPRGLVKIVQEN